MRLPAAVTKLATLCRPTPPLLLLVLACLPLGAAAAVTRVDGDAFDGDSGALRYRESHWLLDDGGRLVLYRCKDGQPFARKQVDGGGSAPNFSLVDDRDGYREGVRQRDGVREMYQQLPGKPERRTALPATETPRVIDAGFDAYLRTHWAALGSAAQQVEFVLPSLQRQLTFRVQRIGETAGQRRYKVSLDAWYGAALPALEVTYAIADKRLLEFRGVGNLRDANGRYPRVRIVFPDTPAQPADAESLRQAREQRLVARCDVP
ncbi:hypothetical protein [Xanthomonas campestris]|uniref:hypothetical protein n=1 Tax=Xanthomonas campestris TaxID=339 RepID=UPI003CEA41A0